MTTTVGTYRLVTSGGKHIRIATKVTIDGKTIRFIDKLSKRDAIRNAKYQLEKHPEIFK